MGVRPVQDCVCILRYSLGCFTGRRMLYPTTVYKELCGQMASDSHKCACNNCCVTRIRCVPSVLLAAERTAQVSVSRWLTQFSCKCRFCAGQPAVYSDCCLPCFCARRVQSWPFIACPLHSWLTVHDDDYSSAVFCKTELRDTRLLIVLANLGAGRLGISRCTC